MDQYNVAILIFQVLILFSIQETLKGMAHKIRLDLARVHQDNWNSSKETITSFWQKKSTDLINIQDRIHNHVICLASLLPSYDFIGYGREDRPEAGGFTTKFYKKELWKLLLDSTIGQFGTTEVPSRAWDAFCNRTKTRGRVEQMDDQNVIFLNAHFYHLGQVARKNVVAFFKRHFRKMSNGKPGMLIQGDKITTLLFSR